MVKKVKKYFKFVVCCVLILSLIAPSYAALSASDGSAFVTKAEFDSALADFNARLTTFEAGINSKIDSQVTSYLDRNGIWNGKRQSSEVVKNYLKGTAGLLFSWTAWGDVHPDAVSDPNWTYNGVTYNTNGVVLPWVTKLTSNKNIEEAMDEITASGGGASSSVVVSFEHPTFVPWINQLFLGTHAIDNSKIGGGIHAESWISTDKPLFTANKSGLAFLYLSMGCFSAHMQNTTTLSDILAGKGTNARNAFALGHLYPWGKNHGYSGIELNKFLTQRSSFSLDVIDRTAHPTPATPGSGVETYETRYPWFSDTLVPYDSQYFTCPTDHENLPLGKAAGYMNSFNVPTTKIITQFFVKKGHRYVLRVVGTHDTPFGNTAIWDAVGLFYSAWAFPTTYYDMYCDVY